MGGEHGGPSAVKHGFNAEAGTSARLSWFPSGKFCPRFFKNSLNTRNHVAVSSGEGRVNNVFAYDFLVSRSHTDQICVVATCTSNRLFSFQVLVESVVLVSFEQRRTLFWNGFLTIMSTPDDGWHKR